MNPASLTRPLRLAAQVPRLAASFMRHGIPDRVLLFGSLSIGDDLLCTTVLREARKRDLPFAMMTARPELFAGNPDPADVIPPSAYYARALRGLGKSVVQPYYARADPTNPDRDVFAFGHILAEMCRLAGLKGEVALRPYLHLTPLEHTAGRRAKRQISFQSTAAGAALPFANKEWGAGRFAEVVRNLPADLTAIQLGLASDPARPGAIDLRGKTTIREAAAVIAESEAFVGIEGFFGHLARAVDCPSVLVLGGRVGREKVGYTCNEYLSAPTPCTPCGLRNQCMHGRACLEGVSAEAVLAALTRVIARRGRDLPVAIARIS